MKTTSREQIVETLRECLQLLAGEKCPADWNGDEDVIDCSGLDSQHGIELACNLVSRLEIDIPLKDNPLIEDGDESGRKRHRTFTEVVDYIQNLVTEKGEPRHMSGNQDSIHHRLRLAREQAGLSQGQVAKLMDYHRPTISEIEAGRRKVSADEIIAFAKTYGVTSGWILNETESDDDPAVELAARELSSLDKDDLDKILRLLRSLKKPRH